MKKWKDIKKEDLNFLRENADNLASKSGTNGLNLLEEAKILLKNRNYNRAYFLGESAHEEMMKSVLIDLWDMGFFHDDEFIKSFESHRRKFNLKYSKLEPHGKKFVETVEGIIKRESDLKNRDRSLYVDVDLDKRKVIYPQFTALEAKEKVREAVATSEILKETEKSRQRVMKYKTRTKLRI
jgi:AbiV family abortive infection protein